MPDTDPLAAARGQLAGLLADRSGLPGEVSLDVCAALIELDLAAPPATSPDQAAARQRPADALRQARAYMRAALPGLDQPRQCRHVAESIAHVDDALAGLVSS